MLGGGRGVPSRLCLIPFTLFITSFVGPLFPLTFPVVAAFAALPSPPPSPKRFERKPLAPPAAPMAVKDWRLRGDRGGEERSLWSSPIRGGSACWKAAADRAEEEEPEDSMVLASCPRCVMSVFFKRWSKFSWIREPATRTL